MRKKSTMILSILFLVSTVYLLIILLVYFFQHKLLFFPDKNLIANPGFYGYKYENVNFNTSDTVSLHGWYIPADSARYTLLFCHGNAGNISHRLESIKQFHELGLNIFIFDYRGYGESEGSISEKGTYLDSQAAWNYLLEEKNIDSKSIIIFGRSLGAAVACDLAVKKQPIALIMESPFISVPDLAVQIYWFLPVRWLSRFEYNNLEKIQKLNCPIWIIHSKQDEIIPFSHGHKLFENAKPPKKFLEIQGAHNDGFLVSQKIYISKLMQFLESLY